MECERAQLPGKEVDGEEFAASMGGRYSMFAGD
jgi:hypothetical protein